MAPPLPPLSPLPGYRHAIAWNLRSSFCLQFFLVCANRGFRAGLHFGLKHALQDISNCYGFFLASKQGATNIIAFQ